MEKFSVICSKHCILHRGRSGIRVAAISLGAGKLLFWQGDVPDAGGRPWEKAAHLVAGGVRL